MNETANQIRIVIIPTRNCNLKCKYCQVETNAARMSDETVETLIKKLKELPHKNIEIQFSGGESLMNFNLVEKVIKSLEGNKYSFFLTTNGTLIKEEMMEILKDLRLKISVSLDGNEKIHDSNRVMESRGSYQDVLKGISILKKYGKAFNSEVVLTPENVSNLYQSLVHIEEVGCNGAFIMPVCGQMWTERGLQSLDENLKIYSKYYVARQGKLKLLNLKDKGECYKFNTEITIDTDGQIFSGNSFLIDPKMYKITKIGDITTSALNQIKRKSGEFIAEHIFPTETIKSFEKAGQLIEKRCKNIEIMSKIKERETLLKKITVHSALNGGDMPYPPIPLWENIDVNNVRTAWKSEIPNIKNKPETNKLGLYIHIPFCMTKCFFCMCKSVVTHEQKEVDSYIKCLKKEILLFKDLFEDLELDSLYFGGGTPSLLTEDELEEILNFIHQNFKFKSNIQKAIEVNPSTMNIKKWETFQKYGLNRMTIGVQTSDEKLAKELNRPQTQQNIIDVVNDAKKYGIKIINIDLIAGMPNQEIKSFEESVDFVLDLEPDLIHINPFSFTKDTGFYKTGHSFDIGDVKVKESLCELGHKIVEDKKQNLSLNEKAKVGQKKLRYLQDYNSSDNCYNILGIGISAISHIQNELHYSKENYQEYIKSISQGKLPALNGFVMDEEEEMRGYIIKTLEENEEGMDLDKFTELFGENILEKYSSIVNFMIKTKKATLKGNKFAISNPSKIRRLINSKYFFSEKIIKKYDRKLENITYTDLDLEIRKLY